MRERGLSQRERNKDEKDIERERKKESKRERK